MDYSPSRLAHGADPKREAEALIGAARDGQIVTVSWHWNAPAHLRDTPAQPWYKGFFQTDGLFGGDHWDTRSIDQEAQLAARAGKSGAQ